MSGSFRSKQGAGAESLLRAEMERRKRGAGPPSGCLTRATSQVWEGQLGGPGTWGCSAPASGWLRDTNRRPDSSVRFGSVGSFREPADRPGDSRGLPPGEEQVGGPAGHAHAPLCLLQHRHQELPPGCGGRHPGPERRRGSPVCHRLLAVPRPAPLPGPDHWTLHRRNHLMKAVWATSQMPALVGSPRPRPGGSL